MSVNEGIPGTCAERVNVDASTGASWAHYKPPVTPQTVTYTLFSTSEKSQLRSRIYKRKLWIATQWYQLLAET